MSELKPVLNNLTLTLFRFRFFFGRTLILFFFVRNLRFQEVRILDAGAFTVTSVPAVLHNVLLILLR